MSSDVRDYLIDQSGLDWSNLLSGWSPPLPQEFTLWLVNRFGDIFAIFEDGSIHHLDLGTFALTRVAGHKDHLAEQMDQGRADDWLMIPLVDRCVAAGLKPGPGQCYRFKTLPLLGGEYDVSNVFVGDLCEHYAFSADIYRQTKDLPNRARVKLNVRKPRGETR